MLVIVNPRADQGRATARWTRIREAVVRCRGPFDECVSHETGTVRCRLATALAQGERRFVAAGGDGTVNLVVNALMTLTRPTVLDGITLGAVGLGSSNDFHKPRGEAIEGVPCRLDFSHPMAHDVGRTAYVDPAGDWRVRYWLLNASVGTTAAGNLLYNRSAGLVGLLKRRSAVLGMAGAACVAVLRHRRTTVTLEREDGTREAVVLCNLGVVKNPHFTGALRYDSPYEPASGDFHVHLLPSTSFLGTVMTLAGLARGRFVGRTARSWRTRRLTLESRVPIAIEGDGEIVLASRVEFGLASTTLRVCP
jgi:diacylglycerol kinase family enzyme